MVWSGGTGERVGSEGGDGAAQLCMAADSALGILAEAGLPSLSQSMALRSSHRKNKKDGVDNVVNYQHAAGLKQIP
jgi:hypothetical protein